MLISIIILVQAIAQNTYFITVDETLNELLKKQPKGYIPWHPSLKQVSMRVQDNSDFYSFIQKKIQIRQHQDRVPHIQHPMEFMEVHGPEFFENLVCKCSFSPLEEAEQEAADEEAGAEENEAGGCEAPEGGDEEGGGGDDEEVELIMKKTKAEGKDFSFLQMSTQSNLNNYATQQPQQQSLNPNMEQLMAQFIQTQTQMMQYLLSQNKIVPSAFPTVVDPNQLSLQQLLAMQQFIQPQSQPIQYVNPLTFQQNQNLIKTEQYQQQIPYQQSFVQQPQVFYPNQYQQIDISQQFIQQQQPLQQQQQVQAQLQVQQPQLTQQQLYQLLLQQQQQQQPFQQQQQQQQPQQQQQQQQQQPQQQQPQQQQQIPSQLQQQLLQQLQNIPQQVQQQQIQQPIQQIQYQQPQQQVQQPIQNVQQAQQGFLAQTQETQYAQQMNIPYAQTLSLQQAPQVIGKQ